jgi:hypothetical protein
VLIPEDRCQFCDTETSAKQTNGPATTFTPPATDFQVHYVAGYAGVRAAACTVAAPAAATSRNHSNGGNSVKAKIVLDLDFAQGEIEFPRVRVAKGRDGTVVVMFSDEQRGRMDAILPVKLIRQVIDWKLLMTL